MKKVALVGCGRISRRHIEAIQANDNLEIACVCDVVKEKAQSISKELSVPFLTDYRTIRNVDIVAILTPSGNHPAHAADIAKNTDIPYLLVEKPISLTVREAYELYDLIDKQEKQLLPVYQNRYNPLIVFLKKLIDSGKLGKIYQFVSNIFWSRNNEYFNIDWHGTKAFDGGILYTQASHYVDMIHFLFGEIIESKGIGGDLRKLEVFDTISAVCKMSNGVVGTINGTVCTYKKNFLTEFTIISERGTIRLTGTNLNRIDFWDVEGIDNPKLDFSLSHEYGKGHDVMYRYIVQEKWHMFPTRDDVLSGIMMMERLSY